MAMLRWQRFQLLLLLILLHCILVHGPAVAFMTVAKQEVVTHGSGCSVVCIWCHL